MPGSTPLGLPYPVDTDKPEGHLQIRALAEAVDTLVDAIPDPPAPSPQSYVHDQVAPSAVWTITHNLGYRPNALVKDSAGTTQFGEIEHVTINQLTITFLLSFGGTAYLS